MVMLLKQSTAVNVNIGPFVDATDAVTSETALTITNTDVRLAKNHGGFNAKGDTNSCTHLENGWYDCALNTTDTNTLGPLQLTVSESGALRVMHDYLVVPANIYDSLVGGSDTLQVDLTQVLGVAASTSTAQLGVNVVSGSTNALTDSVMAADLDVYQAKVWLFDDDSGTTDRYVTIWHKNGTPVTAGITSPTIQVIKASDGSDLIASTAMTQIASTGLYKHDATTTARIADGSAYIVRVQATIDGSARTTYSPIGRDS